MTLVGTYTEPKIGAVLQITKADNNVGQASGSFFFQGTIIPVTINYHFIDAGSSGTTYRFSGADNDPNYYVGGAGYSQQIVAETGIQIAGGYSSLKNVVPFSGLFVRQ